MLFRCARLIGVLDTIGISPEHGITGTASRGDLKGLHHLADQRHNGGKANGQALLTGSQPDAEGDMGCRCRTGRGQ